MTHIRNLTIALSLTAAACATAPVVVPDPEPVTPAVRQTEVFAPSASPARLPQPPVIRVGLHTDESTASFPRIDGGYFLVTDGPTLFTHRGFEARAPMAGQTVQYGVQIGAISDLPSARGLESKLESETDADAVIVFDAASGLNRVIAGSFDSADAARPFRQRLIDAGWPGDAMIVPRPTSEAFEQLFRLTDDENGSTTIASSSILVIPASADEIRIGGAPFRGAARLFINSRGLFNVINELNLEHYVQGVIPNEMGPRQYDELEALKAQALAARTYAIRRLGDFRHEGYDICPTPACQVYRGKGTEHELTNQAVSETAGMVITYDGEPIDALYSATCGGETSDVHVMFPGRDDPYLRHASCVELDMVSVAGAQNGAAGDVTSTRARIFSALTGHDRSSSWAARDVADALRSAMRFAGVAGDPGSPATSRRSDVYRWLYRVWDLDEGASHLLLPQDIAYFFPGADPDAEEIRAASWLIKYEFLPFQLIDRDSLNAAIPRDEMLSVLYTWLRHMKRVEELTGRIRTVDGRRLGVKTESEIVQRELAAGALTFRSIGDRYQELAAVPLLPSDRVTLYSSGGRTVAMVVEANYDGAAFDRTSSYSGWIRSWTDDQLTTAISRRNPIRRLEGFEIMGRDEAERVTELRVLADGRTISLRGLPIRWSLDIPDNIFTLQESVDADGKRRWTFFVKGWGHGTGMCQVGAFGMAFRGHSAEEIIHNYYAGVEIVPLQSVVSR